MAKLPQMLAEPRITAAAGFERIDARDLGNAGIDALGKFAGETGRQALSIAQFEKDARDATGLNTAATGFADALDKKRIELEMDPDHGSRETKFKAFRDAQVAAYGKDLSVAAQRAFQERADRTYLVGAHNLREKARRDLIEETAVKLDDSNNAVLDRAVREPNVVRRAMILQEVDGNIRTAVAGNILTKAQGDRIKKATLQKFDLLQVEGLMSKSPGAAIALLEDREKTPWLDPLDRMRLKQKAEAQARSLNAYATSQARVGLSLYTEAREKKQPVPEAEYERLYTEAQRASPAMARHLAGLRYFYDRVEQLSENRTLPELREMVRGLETGGSLHDLAVARGVRKEMAGVASEESQKFRAQLKEFDDYRQRKPDEPYPEMPALLKRAEDVGGPTMADAVRSQDALYSRLNAARKGSAVDAAERIDMIDKERRAAQKGVLTPEDVYETHALQKVVADKQQELQKDSAAAVLRWYPQVREAAVAAAQSADPNVRARANEAVLDAQRREGLPEHRLLLLTAGQVDDVKLQLKQFSGEKRVQLVESLQIAYGRHWNIAKRQLGDALTPDTRVVADLPPGDTAKNVRVLLGEAFKTSDEDDKKLIASSAIKDVEQQVFERGLAARSTIDVGLGAGEVTAQYERAAEKLARLYVRRGDAPSSAAKRAWDDVFYNHYDVVGTVRVPKDMPSGDPAMSMPSRVRELQRFHLDQLDKVPLLDPVGTHSRHLTPEQRRTQLLAAVRANPFWVTTGDGRGMALMLGPGQPLFRADSTPYTIDFGEPLSPDQRLWRGKDRFEREQNRLPVQRDPVKKIERSYDPRLYAPERYPGGER